MSTVSSIPRARRVDLQQATRLKREIDEIRQFLMHLCRTPDQVLSVELHDSIAARDLRVAGLVLPASINLDGLRGQLITITNDALDARLQQLVDMGVIP